MVALFKSGPKERGGCRLRSGFQEAELEAGIPVNVIH